MKNKTRRNGNLIRFLLVTTLLLLPAAQLLAQSSIPNILAFWEANGLASNKEKITLLKLSENYNYKGLIYTVEEEEFELGEGIISVLLDCAALQDKRLLPQVEKILLANAANATMADVNVMDSRAISAAFLQGMNKGIAKFFVDRMKVCWLLDLFDGRLPIKVPTYAQFLQQQGVANSTDALWEKYITDCLSPLIASPSTKADYTDYVLTKAKALLIGDMAIFEDLMFYMNSLSDGETPHSFLPRVEAVMDSWVAHMEKSKK